MEKEKMLLFPECFPKPSSGSLEVGIVVGKELSLTIYLIMPI